MRARSAPARASRWRAACSAAWRGSGAALARIDTYQRSVGLQPTNTQSPGLSNAVADVRRRCGGRLQAFRAIHVQKGQERENSAAENAYRKLNLDLQNELETRAQNIEPGGAGFHDSFVSEVFTPKRNEFLQTIPARL